MELFMQGVLNLKLYCFYPTQVRPESDLTDCLIETWMIWPLLKKVKFNPFYILEPFQNMYNMQRRKYQTKPNLPNQTCKTKYTKLNILVLKLLPIFLGFRFRKIWSQKRISFGFEKIWSRKKVSVSISENLVSEKVSEMVSEKCLDFNFGKFGFGKKYRKWFWKN